MANAGVERRLSAIMAADVVGYSRLIETDEPGTLAALRDLRQAVLQPLLTEHRGRIVKLMGDGLIAEFGSIVSAVACAAAVQKQLPCARRLSRCKVGAPLSGREATWSSSTTCRPIKSEKAVQCLKQKRAPDSCSCHPTVQT